MSEARELLERFRDNLRSLEKGAAEQRVFDLAEAMAQSAIALELALATQPKPEPGAVPELPEWLRWSTASNSWRVPLGRGGEFGIPADLTPNDLARIAEACTKLAARERARRAGS